MKKAYVFLSVSLLSFLMTAGALFAPVTAFSLPANGLTLLLACAVSGLLWGVLVCIPKRSFIRILLLAAFGAVIFWKREMLMRSAASAVQALIDVFSGAFPQLSALTVLHAEGADATAFLCALAVLLTFLCASTIARGRALPALLATAPFLVLSLFILEYGPAPAAAIAYVLGGALLLLSQSLRRQDAAGAGKLSLRLLLPTAALLGVLLLLIPAEGYQRTALAEQLRSKVNDTAEELQVVQFNKETGGVEFVSPIQSALGSFVWDSGVNGFDLARVGPQRNTGAHVMDVLTTEGGTCYLRGVSMGIYEDNRWKKVPASMYELGTYEPIYSDRKAVEEFYPSESGQSFQIRTDRAASLYYVPNYALSFPEDAVPVYDAYLKNPGREKEYAFRLIPNLYELSMLRDENYDWVKLVYTQVPENTKAALAGNLAEIRRTVEALQESPNNVWTALTTFYYVQNSARYDLNTPNCPPDRDFTDWFLNDSETGYCVHFATAYAVLLRCQGIPARLVTGYLASPISGQWTPVTEDSAHAWVEVYLDGGWYLLDPTPEQGTVVSVVDPNHKPIPAPTDEQKQTENDHPEIPEKNTDETPKISEKPVEKIKMPLWVWMVGGVLVLLIVWQIVLRLLRRAAMERGSTNKRAIGYYRHLCFLEKLGGEKVPEDITALAMKARFSQHKLTDADLDSIQMHAASTEQTLFRNSNVMKKTMLVVLLALPRQSEAINRRS